MGNRFSWVLVIAMLAASSAPSFAATAVETSLFAAFGDGNTSIAKIPDGYFEPVSLDTVSLFSFPPNSRHELVLPRLGRIAVVHDRTRLTDFGDVVRWEGHVRGRDAMTVTFAKGVAGMVSGVINTPAGRVLLGQAGDYVLYKQSRELPLASQSDTGAVPQALLKAPRRDDAQDGADKPAAVAYPIEFNAAAVAAVPDNGEVEVMLPGAGSFRVVHDNTLAGDLGATTFVGYLKDFGDDYRMVVTYSPGGAQGQILTPYGTYLIQTVGRRQWLIDVAGSGLRHVVPSRNDAVDRHGRSAAAANGPLARSAAAGAATALGAAVTSLAAGAPAATASDKTRIDVLVVYTPGLEARYGGETQVQTRIQNLVALANQAYVDSGVAISLRLVAAVKVDAPDDSDQLDALNAITKGTGPYANIEWLRDVYGADLVSLLRPFSLTQGGLCGTGWVGGTNGAAISLYRSQGFTVVSDGRDGGYYCSAYTLAHELGHNMGSVHDRATVARQDGNAGAYPYSYGYGVAGQFGTIMSYIDPEVGKFSNPNISCRTQAPCGVAAGDAANSADNALSLNNTRGYVAAYTPEAAVATQMVSIAGVVTFQGQALGGVQFRSSSSAKCSSTGDNGSFSCVVAKNWSGDITPTLSGYTFSPEKLTLTDLTGNTADRNFVAAKSKNLSLAAAASPSTGSGGGGAVGVESLVVAALVAGVRRRRATLCRDNSRGQRGCRFVAAILALPGNGNPITGRVRPASLAARPTAWADNHGSRHPRG